MSANREWGTGNREQGTGNREQGTGNREQGTGNREQGTGTSTAGVQFANAPLPAADGLAAKLCSRKFHLRHHGGRGLLEEVLAQGSVGTDRFLHSREHR